LKLETLFQILTDLGGEFQNELWKEMCKLLGITRLRTTAYCPSTNGKVERWHRSLHAMMAKVVDVKQKRWVEFLPYVTPLCMVRRASHQTFYFSGVNLFLQSTLPSVAQDLHLAL